MRLGESKKSQVQIGVTVHNVVNPIPHLWVRAKEAWRSTGYKILDEFAKTVFAKYCQTVRRPATMLGYFEGHDWGVEDTWGAAYLPSKRGDKLTLMQVPPHCASEGWSLVMAANGKRGLGAH